MKRLIAMTATCLVVLSACATGGLSGNEKLALYNAHAGAPVNQFNYFGSVNGWTPLGDEAIAVWTRPNEAYLLDFSGPCPNIEFAPAIGLSGRIGTVISRFDKVLVYSNSTVSIPCSIDKIRPLDVKAIKEAERTARDQIQSSS